MRVVIDTNIIISGIFFGGNPRSILSKCYTDLLTPVCTESIFAEYIEIIERISKRSKKYSIKDIEPLLAEYFEIIEEILFGQYSRDPDDDKFINCAISSGSEYIISGDNDLLILKEVESVKIVDAKYFLEEIIPDLQKGL